MDERVRCAIYEMTMRDGVPPSSVLVAAALGIDAKDALESFERLAEAHMIVLKEDGRGEILMAGPFSAIPTPFQVSVNVLVAYANCVWDSLGIPAMMRADAVIDTNCADCGSPAQLLVNGGRLTGTGFMHFVVPARLWWSHIVYT
jgi:Alkylmercury lyase